MSEAFPQFLRDVEFALGIDSQEYLEFSQLIGALQIRRTGVVHVRSRIEEILKDHPILLDQFKRFFQQGHDEPTPPLDGFKQALDFVNKVKKRLHGDQRYRSFLSIITAYSNSTIGIMQLYREMRELLGENRDLMAEFTLFLPPT